MILRMMCVSELYFLTVHRELLFFLFIGFGPSGLTSHRRKPRFSVLFQVSPYATCNRSVRFVLCLLPPPRYKNYGAYVKNTSTLYAHDVVRIPVQISLFTTRNLRPGLRRLIFFFFFLYVSTAHNIST